LIPCRPCRKLDILRIVGPHLIAALLLASLGGSAAADREPSRAAPSIEADSPFSKWVVATERLRLASSFLNQTFDLPDLTRRLSAYFDVELRRAFAAGEAWLTGLADQVAPSLAVPDVTVLRASPVKGIESSGYGWREDPIDGGGRFHKGTDYRADRGTPVYAAGDGLVAFAGRQNGYGRVIYVDHGGGLITRYAHQSSIEIEKGDIVVADTLIGAVGSTGRTTGPHLHFEVRLDGRAVDPGLAMDIAEIQRTQPPAMARIAAMALLPEAQTHKVDRHGPPKSKNRPERRGRSKRVVPTT
jgi:murein DD-endopeptidase MepM/ murein hydrolase activator NlpD